MSWVANMMLSVGFEDRDRLESISQWLQTEAPRREPSGSVGVGFLKDITVPDSNHWGGWKNPECDVWAGALNHAQLPAIIDRVAAEQWQTPAAVQLLIMDQEETYFRLWMIRDGRIQQFAPPPPDDDTAW